MGRAEHSSRVACLSVIKEHHREGLGSLGLSSHEKKKIIIGRKRVFLAGV